MCKNVSTCACEKTYEKTCQLEETLSKTNFIYMRELKSVRNYNKRRAALIERISKTYAFVPFDIKTLNVDTNPKPENYFIVSVKLDATDKNDIRIARKFAEEKLYHFIYFLHMGKDGERNEQIKKIIFEREQNKKFAIISFEKLEKLKKRSWRRKQECILFNEFEAKRNNIYKGKE